MHNLNYRVPIGFLGKKGHGKTTAGRMLESLGDTRLHPATTLRDMLHVFLRDFGLDEITRVEMLDGRLKRDIIPGLNCSPTHLQQTLGTEWGRVLVEDNIWLKILDKKIEYIKSANTNFVFFNDSIRFHNEAEWMRSHYGKLIRIVDPRKKDDQDEHPSEQEGSSIEVDYTIINNGSIDILRDKLHEVIFNIHSSATFT
jgi:hypothetical protein